MTLAFYEAADSLTDDLIEVPDEIFNEFSVFTDGEKVRVARGMVIHPAWGIAPLSRSKRQRF